MADKSGDLDHQTNWRDKYLNALDAQEALEQTFTRQQELLHRALVRISLTADGQDEELDLALARTRHLLRAKIDDLQPALAQLDEALAQFEQRRAQAQQDISRALAQTLLPLEKFSLPHVLKKEIDHYRSQLPKRVTKLHLYPALLHQLADIQQQVLAQEPAPASGLWQKLFKHEITVSDVRAEMVMAAEVNKNPVLTSADTVAECHADTESLAVAQRATSASGGEVLAKINTLLITWLEYMNIPEELSARAQEIRVSLQQPGSDAHIFSLLESVRTLVIDASLIASRAFATYLDNVNQELADIYRALDGAVHHQTQQIESAQGFENSVLQQMTDLETEADEATDLDQLKSRVKFQLGNIRQALDQLHNKGQDQQQLSTQLQELAEKIKAMEAEAENTRSTLEQHRFKALHDPLTELPNREAYSERMRTEFGRWQRYQHPLSLAICDLDHFKRINDTFGHQAGDRVLKVISRSISKRLRQVDFFGRYGGEEFVAILPETDLKNARALLEKIRFAIAHTAFNYKEQPLEITLSVGITEFQQGDTMESAFARADKALYAAKAAGRNCVITAGEA